MKDGRSVEAGGPSADGPHDLSVLLVDPALFTEPYDAALTEGLLENGVSVRWATRAARPGEAGELPREMIEPIYYARLEASAKTGGKAMQVRKGLSHLESSLRLIRLRDRLRPDICHVQWPVLPAADLLALRLLKRRTPVVLTVHDSVPFNGIPTSRIQHLGYDTLLKSVDHLITHTERGRDRLLAAGIDGTRISVVPHGPLRLRTAAPVTTGPRNPRWTFVLFGKLQGYKGADLLIEAADRMEPAARGRLRIVIAGEPVMDVGSLRDRISASGLQDCVELRAGRLSETEMAALFDEADAFVFPYRRIDASGVFHLVRGQGKWIVASDLGSFSEEIQPERGRLVRPEDADALAAALEASVGRRPGPSVAQTTGWGEIGRRTRRIYLDLLTRRAGSGM